MKSRPLVLITASIVITLALPVHFVAQTLLADELTAENHVALLAVATFALVTLVTGIPRRSELAALGRGGAVRAALAGFLGVYASQQLVLANRFTDAPPGAEVIFFTTAAWGLIVVLAALLVRSERPTFLQVVLAGIALAGAAAILANWERPSSFSPFVRYPTEHGGMLLAGVGWAGLTLLVAPLGRRHRWRAILPLASATAAVTALAVALFSPLRGELISKAASSGPELIVAASSFAAIVISWSWLVAALDTVRPASLLFLPPVTLTILGVFERQSGGMGPSPLLWDVVWWACAVTGVGALGLVLLWRSALSGGSHAPGDASTRRHRRAEEWLGWGSVVLGMLATAASLVVLWSPALSGHVVGSLSGGAGYEVSWTAPGAETIGALLVALASLAVLAGSLGLVRRGWRRTAMLKLSAGLLVVLLAVPVLAATPLRTWTRWIPGEVQHDYGTEYARLTLEPTDRTATYAAVALAGASVLGLSAASALGIVRARNIRNPASAGATDERQENDG